MKELEKIALKHDRWVALVQNMGCNPAYCEDVVQDAYLKIYKHIEEGRDITYGEDDINDFYVYMTLRSIYIDACRKKGLEFRDIADPEVMEYHIGRMRQEYADVEQQQAFDRLINNIHSEINTWDFYNRNIFIAYFTSGLSFDKLSADTGIGRSSLYNSIRKHREVIRDVFSEDVEDYYNGDYNLI